MEQNNNEPELNNGSNAGNLPIALEYIARGMKIFPCFYVLKDGSCSCHKKGCRRIGKHPCTRNGVQDATSDEAQIKQWWTESPYANIGLATGHGGVIVLDEDCGLDEKTGKQKVGPASLKALVEQNAPLPATLVANSGSGGRHFYFLTTKDIKNRTDCPGKHLDVRGYGGYVLLPGSNHKSGTKYSWVDGEAQIAGLPECLENLLTKESNIEISGDIDAALQARIAKSLKEDNVASADQLVKLLYMCGPDGARYLPPDCDRTDWWQIGAALKKELGEKKGWEVWKEWSKENTHPVHGWDDKTGLVQWNSFTDKGLTAGTIIHFAKQNGFPGFDKEAANAPEIRDNWIYAVAIKRFVETDRLLEWDKEQFDATFSPLFTRGNPSVHVLKNSAFKRVDGVTYWPKQPLYVEEYGQSKLNYWRPSDVTPAPGDVTRFTDHVKYLFPEGPEGDILLDYLAFQIQHPGEKVHWAVLLEGDQGNGKSYFATVMRLVLGAHNVKMVNNDQLHEPFTHWQRNTQLIVVEEMMAKGRLELMNKLKPMITEPWCQIREMYRPAYEQPNRFNFLFFTNHGDSLLIDNKDRRYCILKTDSPPHPDANAYYAPLFDWTRANGPALAHYLENRPLGNFMPKAHAPMTAGKRAMIRQSMTPLKQFIDEHVQAKEYPLQWDLISISALVKPLTVEFNLRTNTKEIANVFKDLGYLDLGRKRTGQDDERVYMWAVRDFDTYLDLNAEQLRTRWAYQVNNTPAEPGAGTVDALYKDRQPNPIQGSKM